LKAEFTEFAGIEQCRSFSQACLRNGQAKGEGSPPGFWSH